MDGTAPGNALKVIVGILAIFVLVALYGQWQHRQRAQVVRATIVAAPNELPTPSPNEKR